MNKYFYRQNNSGGSFDVLTWTGPKERGHIQCGSYSGLMTNVVVFADTEDEADFFAQKYAGVYFDGAGDCSCCGNRWYGAELMDDDDDE